MSGDEPFVAISPACFLHRSLIGLCLVLVSSMIVCPTTCTQEGGAGEGGLLGLWEIASSNVAEPRVRFSLSRALPSSGRRAGGTGALGSTHARRASRIVVVVVVASPFGVSHVPVSATYPGVSSCFLEDPASRAVGTYIHATHRLGNPCCSRRWIGGMD